MKGGIRGVIRRIWEDEQLLWQLLLAGEGRGRACQRCCVHWLGSCNRPTNLCITAWPLVQGWHQFVASGIPACMPLCTCSCEKAADS